MAISKNGEVIEDAGDLRTRFQSFLSGDNAAFSGIYRDVNPRLSAYCHKLSPGNADDLMQELWERVIAMRSQAGSSQRRAPRDSIDSPLAFLFRMLKNLAIDEFRKTRDDISLDNDATDVTYPSHIVGYDKDEPSAIECIIIEALGKLYESDREVLVLNIYSGYNYSEIAEILGKSADAIWQRASRARIKLRKIVIDDAARMGIALPKIDYAAMTAKKNEAII